MFNKFRFAAMAILTFAVFLGAAGTLQAATASDQQSTTKEGAQTAPAAEVQQADTTSNQVTASGCGTCVSTGGSTVNCDKATQKWDCSSKNRACATTCE